MSPMVMATSNTSFSPAVSGMVAPNTSMAMLPPGMALLAPDQLTVQLLGVKMYNCITVATSATPAEVFAEFQQDPVSWEFVASLLKEEDADLKTFYPAGDAVDGEKFATFMNAAIAKRK
jgi:hypothetical protein